MRRSEVEAWINSGSKPGRRGQAVIKEIKVPNPTTSAAEKIKNPEITVRQVTWTRNDGETLTVIDHQRRDQEAIANDFVKNPDGTQTYDPDYDVTGGEGVEPPRDTRTPEKKADDEREAGERAKNRKETGHDETDSERRIRERKELLEAEDRARRARDEARNDRQEAAQTAAQAEAAAARREGNQVTREGQAIERDRLGLEGQKFDWDREKANRPSLAGEARYDNPNVAVWDPVTGTIERQDNPIYDRARTEAERLREELAARVAAGKYTMERAAAEYDRWFKRNVEVPFLRSAEARAQATDRRAALEARERDRQFAAQHSLARGQLGQRAGEAAMQAESSTLPYRVGPAFGGQFASALNSVAAGGKMDANASAGINFTSDAFEYNKPDFSAIAKKAAKQALKNVSSYKPPDIDYPSGDYSGITMPTNDTMSGMPGMAPDAGVDEILEQIKNNRYGIPINSGG